MSKYNLHKYFSPQKNINKKNLEQNNNFQYNKNSNRIINEYKLKDDKLSFTLSMLGLSRLINFFNEKNISFRDLLILSKESMKELKLEMYQRNRIFNFSKFYNKTAKNYSMEEIIKFFEDHKQFILVPKIFEEIKSTNNININQESPRFKNDTLKNKE